MIAAFFGILLALGSIGTLIVARAYGEIPPKELKRRARQGDAVAVVLYRTVAYGANSFILLSVLGVAFGYAAFVLLEQALGAWLALPMLLLLALGAAFAVQSRGGMHDAGVWLALKISPGLAWLLERIHPVLDSIARFMRRFMPIHIHSGLYEKSDLVTLLTQQKQQPDNRIAPGEIDLLTHALSFGDKTVADALVPKRVVKTVSIDETVGPVLMGELHATGHSRFPVYEGGKDQIVGTLYLHDLVSTKVTGVVRDIMHKKVTYVHENFTLYQTLQAFIKTKQHLFIVVNEFEEYVGIITIEDVLERVIGKLIVDEFDQYDDLRAVAAAAAQKEHAESPHAPEE